jgi:hypothetical protein
MIAVVVIIFILLIFAYNSLYCCKYVFWNLAAQKEYKKIYKKYGRADFTNVMPNGVAVWKKPKDSPFERIMIIDDKSTSKCGFLYLTVKSYMEPQLIEAALSATKTLTYNRCKEELTAGCDTFDVAMATLAVSIRTGKGLISAGEVDEIYKKELLASESNSQINYSYLMTIKDEYELKHADILS